VGGRGAAVAGAWLAVALIDSPPEPEPEPDPVARAEPVPAAAASARPATVLNASGYVVPRRVATIASKVTGQIVSVAVEEGQRVAAGDVLARLDDAIARAELELAERRLATARSAEAEIRVRVDEALRTLERSRSLRAQRLASEAELDAADANAAALAARRVVAEREVAVAESAVALARQRLDDTVIRAPFDGVVVSKNAQPGETISPMSSGGFTRTGIATVVDMSSLEIEVDVNEAFINRVADGQPVEAVLDAYPDWRIPARVISIVPTADRQKATVKVRIGFDALDPRILPEMGVQVWFMEEDGA
jgi:RND family efflux transporter MFP subunit